MSRPDLFWVKNIGPFEEILIKKEIIGKSHDSMQIIITKENIMSNSLFNNLFRLSFKGSLRKLKTGTLSKKSILTLRRGKPLKSGTTLNRIKCWSEKSTRDWILSV